MSTTDDATKESFAVYTGSEDDFVLPETVDNFGRDASLAPSTDDELVLPQTVDTQTNTPSPNPRVMVTKPSSSSLLNVVRYNTNESYENILEEGRSDVEYKKQVDPEYFYDDQELSSQYFVNDNDVNDSDDEEAPYYENDFEYANRDDEYSGPDSEEDIELGFGKYEKFYHDLHKLSIISDSDLEEDDPSSHPYLNYEYDSNYDQPGIQRRTPSTRYGRADMDFDIDVKRSSSNEDHDYINFEYDPNYDQPGIQPRSKNSSTDQRKNINSPQEIPENENCFDGMSDPHVGFEAHNQEFFDNLDRLADHRVRMNSDVTGPPEKQNDSNTSFLEDLDTELQHLKKFSENNDTFNSSEVREVEALIEEKEKEIMYGERAVSRNLSESEVDDALLALYSARIHQRKSFKKNFVKILKIKNPSLAHRKDIVNSVMELNNSLDRYKLKQIQDAAKEEYRLIVTSSRNSKRRERPRRRRKRRKRLNRNRHVAKKVDITPSEDLVKLTKEILNTFPESPTIQHHIVKLNESLASHGYTSSGGDFSRSDCEEIDKENRRCRVNSSRATREESDGYDNSASSSGSNRRKRRLKLSSKDKGGKKTHRYDETEEEYTGVSNVYDNTETKDGENFSKQSLSDGYDGDETEENENVGYSDGYDGDETEEYENIGDSDGYDGDETDNNSKPRIGNSQGYEDSESQEPFVDTDGYDGTQSEELPKRKNVKKKRKFKLRMKKRSKRRFKSSPKVVHNLPTAQPPSIPSDYSTDHYRLPTKPALPPSGSAPKVPPRDLPSSTPPPKPPSSLSIRSETPSETDSSSYEDDYSPLHFGSSFGSDFPGCELVDIKYSDSEVSHESYDTVHDDRRRELMVQRYLKHAGFEISSDLTDVEHEYDTDPDDFAPEQSGRLTASNEYIFNPRRTQSVAVMQKCDELLDDFDNLQRQEKDPAYRSRIPHEYTQSTPVLNHTVINSKGFMRNKGAVSYHWEEIEHEYKNNETQQTEDELVTIRFTKPPNQSLDLTDLPIRPLKLGATIIEEKTSGAILVKRILEESPIAACNKVHVGDELTRINGAPIGGFTLTEVCNMLATLVDDCTLTFSKFGTVTNHGQEYTVPKSRYFRAFFNYNPEGDETNPCKEASLSFELGDILEVVNTEDDSWWQAKKYGSSTVGLVPSHDQRLKYIQLKAGKPCKNGTVYLWEKKKKSRGIKGRDNLFTFGKKAPEREPLTYIEVTHVRPSRNKRRPIIITGAKGYGGSCLRQELLSQYPDKYHTPVLHTTRPEKEANGSYHYITKKQFSKMIKEKAFIHYSKSNGYYTGTSFQSVTDLILKASVCLLDVHPQYLPILCNKTIRPHVIFVEATTEEKIKDIKRRNPNELPMSQRKLTGTEIRELRFNSERLLRRYTEFVDTIITLEGMTSALDLINQVTDRIIHHPAWMPRKWLDLSTI